MLYRTSCYESLVATRSDLTVLLPDATFHDSIEIHGSGRSVELITYREGHTPSDTVPYLPTEGIIFLSDLLFVDRHPFPADGDPDNLLFTLEEIAIMEASDLIPGHGPTGPKQDIVLPAQYHGDCRITAAGLLENELDEEAIKTQTILAKISF